LDFDESPEENEQESDESDDDFELRMATISEDEDTNIAADEDAVELPPDERQCSTMMRSSGCEITGNPTH
jgi:hypothetical protein